MPFKSFKLKEGHKISFYRSFYDQNPIIYITNEPCLPENIRTDTSIVSIQTLDTNTEILKNIACLPNDIQPVCGNNGITYTNECYSFKANTNVAYNGQCSSIPTPSQQSQQSQSSQQTHEQMLPSPPQPPQQEPVPYSMASLTLKKGQLASIIQNTNLLQSNEITLIGIFTTLKRMISNI